MTIRIASIATIVVACLQLVAIDRAASGQDSSPPAKGQVDGDPNLKKSPDFSSDEIYLVESALKAFRVVKKIDLPNRVYLKRTVTSKKYQSFLTEPDGKLFRPEQFLLGGTVVRGDRIGGSKERYYALTNEGWRRAEPPEVYQLKDDDAAGETHTVRPPIDR